MTEADMDSQGSTQLQPGCTIFIPPKWIQNSDSSEGTIMIAFDFSDLVPDNDYTSARLIGWVVHDAQATRGSLLLAWTLATGGKLQSAPYTSARGC